MSIQLIHGSAHSIPIPDESVQVIITSPPFYGLRKYSGGHDILWPTVEYTPMPGLPPIRVQGCEEGCGHEWADGPVRTQSKQRDNNPDGNQPGAWFGGTRGENESREGQSFKTTQGAYCLHCGGWRGELGLEPDVSMYIAHLILCLREWRRILRSDGTIFCNLGDSYAGGGGFSPNSPSNLNGSLQSAGNRTGERNIKGGRKISGGKRVYKMRSDLTDEQIAYVMEELAKARRTSSATQDGRE